MDADDIGPDGNARLTAATGVVLLVMLAVEGFTVLDVRGMITLHLYLGLMLVGPTAIKLASTLYRFARYYSGSEPYVRKGPPHPVLRLLGPVVVLSTLALLGTGVALVFVKPGDGPLLFAHKASFVIWFGAMTIHVLGHLRDVFVESAREVRSLNRGTKWRLSVIVASVALGVFIASVLLPSAADWRHRGSETSFGNDH